MVKAILFDLDDTLLWDKKSVAEAFRVTCAKAANRYDIDPVRFEEKVREQARQLYETYETYPFTRMIGINPFEGLWGDFNDEGDSFRKLAEIAPEYRRESWARGLLGMGIDNPELANELAELFRKTRREKVFVYDDTIAVLDKLKESYILGLLTNGSPDLQSTKLDMTPALQPYFDDIFISGAFGKGKPDPAIFRHALNELKVDKEDAVMVGDNLNTDILGANKAGITSIWINRHGKKTDLVKPTHTIESLNELPSILD